MMTKIEIVKTETSRGNQIRVNRFISNLPVDTNVNIVSSYSIKTKFGRRFYTVLKYAVAA